MTSLFKFLLSLTIVALGQPARVGWLGALASVCGYALFFSSLAKHRRFFWGATWFAFVQLIQLSWMTSIEFQGYYILFVYGALSLCIGCQFGLLTLMVPSEGKIPFTKILTCAAFWTLIEWSRLLFLCGFSWNPIGLALTHFSLSLQFASLFGIFGLSFWVILTNLSVLNAVRIKRWTSALALAAIPYLFGALQLGYHAPKSEQSIDVALVQTSLLPSEKIFYPGRVEDFISPLIQWQEILAALKAEGLERLDMIVLPEAAVPLQSDWMLYPFEAVRDILVAELGPDIEQAFPPFAYPFAEERKVSNLFWCQTLANYFKAELVIGLDHVDKESKNNFNSVFLCRPNSELKNRYDKRVLLPLAEYLPFNFLKPLVKRYGIMNFFTHGREALVMGEKNPFSPSICYEETFPGIMREGRLMGAKLFVNVTNDNYYPDSSLHEQHLYHARVRAVENGIPHVRSCNSGVSAAVDSFGRIVAKTEGYDKNLLHCSLNSYAFATLYTLWGEGFIVGISLGICLLFGVLKRILQIPS